MVSNKLVEEEESGLGLLKVSPREVFASVKRIVTNPLWMSDMLSANFRYFALAGYYISKPKYLESQYHKSASDAALFSGTTGLMSQAGGILLGGVFIRYLKPSPKNLTIFIMFVELWVNAALLSGFFLGCPGSQFVGYNTLDDQGVKLVFPFYIFYLYFSLFLILIFVTFYTETLSRTFFKVVTTIVPVLELC